jgi:hypothetical protein
VYKQSRHRINFRIRKLSHGGEEIGCSAVDWKPRFFANGLQGIHSLVFWKEHFEEALFPAR